MPQTTPTPTSTTATAAPAPRAQLRTLPLSRLAVAEGFNPRQVIVRDAAYDALVGTVRERGLLQSLRVRETETGDYVVIAGHRRFCAAVDAALMEVPCLVVPAGTGDEAEEAQLRVDALIENDVRVDLSPVDRALAYAKLRRDGLTVRGIAQQLATTQARVKEHLQILEIPEDLHPPIADRTIPLHATRALAQLSALHAELPTLAVARVVASQNAEHEEPITWAELAADPVHLCTSSFDFLGGQRPAGVFDKGERVELAELALDEKAQKNLAALEKLGRTPTTLCFDREDLDRAEALGALHRGGAYGGALIVGTDVVAQLVGDAIASLLKHERKIARDRRAAEAAAAALAIERGDVANGQVTAPAAPVETAAQREEREKTERASARAQELAQRAEAEAFNDRLGAALVGGMSRVKVDARTLGIVLSLTIAADVDMLAMRGARYGFPGWVTETETADGKTKHGYLLHPAAGDKAREYLAGANTPGDYAGRALALVAMAIYADQGAVAMSNRVQHSVTAAGTPWADRALEDLDELIAASIPAGILSEQLAARAEERAEHARELADQRAALAQLEAGLAELDQQTPEQLNSLLAAVGVAYRPYAHERYPVERRIRDAIAALRQADTEDDAAEQ